MKILFKLAWTELLHSNHVKVVLIMENKVDAHFMSTLNRSKCASKQSRLVD